MSYSFNQFDQTTDSFKNETIKCLYECVTESLTRSILSKTLNNSVTKHYRVLLGDGNCSAMALFGTIGEIEQVCLNHLVLTTWKEEDLC